MSQPILATAQHSQPLTVNGIAYTLVTKVDCSEDGRRGYTCNKIVQGTFYLLPENFTGAIPADAESAGRIGSNIIDKSLAGLNQPEPRYVHELLDIPKQIGRAMEHVHPKHRLSELQATMKHIYDKTGEPRIPFYEAANVHAALVRDKVHLVIEFQVDRQYWGTSLAQAAMLSYDQAMVQLPQAAGIRTMILSPAPLTDVLETVENPRARDDIIARLVLSYARSGYAVWSVPEPPPAKQYAAAFTIMGKSLP